MQCATPVDQHRDLRTDCLGVGVARQLRAQCRAEQGRVAAFLRIQPEQRQGGIGCSPSAVSPSAVAVRANGIAEPDESPRTCKLPRCVISMTPLPWIWLASQSAMEVSKEIG